MQTWLRVKKHILPLGAAALLAALYLWLVASYPQWTRSAGPVSWGLVTPLPSVTCTGTATATRAPTQTPTATATSAPTSTATPTPSPTALQSRVLSVPVILQEQPLSCEFAAMRMVLAACCGKPAGEAELIACMPRNPNPYLGFRGDPAGYNRHADGSINWDNYGVYADAVAEALNRCTLEPAGVLFRARASKNTSYEDVAKAVLGGYPVIVWVTKRQSVETTQVDTPQGAVRLVMGEHVWVVVGYHADGMFDVHDPYPQPNQVQTLHAYTFPNWELFDRMAVFIEPAQASTD